MTDAKTIFEDLYRSVFALPHLSAEGKFYVGFQSGRKGLVQKAD